MASGGQRTARPTKLHRPQVDGYTFLAARRQRFCCFFVRDRLERGRLPETFAAGVSETAKARARSVSSVRSSRNGVIETQWCSIAQRSVPFAAPSSGVTVNQKIERPIGSLSGTTLPS